MSADFWASYASGALGILIGNRLDVLKVQAQAGLHLHPPASSTTSPLLPTTATSTPTRLAPSQPPVSEAATTTRSENVRRITSLFRGAAAPILGYGALNSILFMTFNRTIQTLDPAIPSYTKLAGVDLSKIWVAGAFGGLATWIVSAPSEYVKCRAQLLVDGQGSSYGVFKDTLRSYGVRGLYHGGVITSVRDAVGYGWYFWSYELCKRLLLGRRTHDPFGELRAVDVLVAGGVAGVVTWASIYPLDVVKTRLQTRVEGEGRPLLEGPRGKRGGPGSAEVAREIWRESGLRGFYRGVGVCSLRAFVVNAVQWYTYERIMAWLGPQRWKEPLSVG